jgi:hypothetical protein
MNLLQATPIDRHGILSRHVGAHAAGQEERLGEESSKEGSEERVPEDSGEAAGPQGRGGEADQGGRTEDGPESGEGDAQVVASGGEKIHRTANRP